MTGRIIMFWSRNRREVCFIHEDYSGILFTVPGSRKKLTKEYLRTRKIKEDFPYIPLYYSHRQHTAVFKGNKTRELVKSIARSRKNLWYWEIEL